MFWKIAFFVFIFFVYTRQVSSDDLFDRTDHLHDLLFSGHSIFRDHIARRKRRIDSGKLVGGRADASTRCIIGCTNQLKRATEKCKTVLTDSATGSIKIHGNMTLFNQVCSAARPSVECFDRCPPSTLKTQIQPSVEPLRYMCIDHIQDFNEYAPCYQKVETRTQRSMPGSVSKFRGSEKSK